MYRDELSIPGFDLAYFRNGYVYHTLRDDMRTMDTGSLQHTGDNVVAVVRELTVGGGAQLLRGYNAKRYIDSNHAKELGERSLQKNEGKRKES